MSIQSRLGLGLAVLAVLSAPLGAQLPCGGCLLATESSKPQVQPVRVLGEVAAGTVGFTLGSEGGLVAAAGLAYIVRGHGGDITTPGLTRVATGLMVAGGGLGAATSTWLVSRANGQTSNWGANALATTAVNAIAYRIAGWPMTRETEARRRTMSRLRLLSPVWMSALTSTLVATATRERR